ncbi:DUF5677 domain-containing protein [Vibrio vulnificus]|uniref:DUF5677 domain-containing protein n=1 Tax=Vibrio vulnificus TaxID=672 RepID=UPI0031338BD6
MQSNYQFSDLTTCIQELEKFKASNRQDEFFKEEVLRFYSIAGTVIETFDDIEHNVNQRMISHILIRSLLENFFWLLYIYDDSSKSAARFEEYLNGFKIEYRKLYDDPNFQLKNSIEKPDASWASLKKPKNVNDVLTGMFSVHGDRLNHLYPLYRVSSFDTHGKSLKNLFEASFKKSCDFPYIKIKPIVDLMADLYVVTWNQIKP